MATCAAHGALVARVEKNEQDIILIKRCIQDEIVTTNESLKKIQDALAIERSNLCSTGISGSTVSILKDATDTIESTMDKLKSISSVLA